MAPTTKNPPHAATATSPTCPPGPLASCPCPFPYYIPATPCHPHPHVTPTPAAPRTSSSYGQAYLASMRLAGGRDGTVGRLEVLPRSALDIGWGTVCARNFDEPHAQVGPGAGRRGSGGWGAGGRGAGGRGAWCAMGCGAEAAQVEVWGGRE